MNRNFTDITGLTFGTLTAIAPTNNRICGKVVWECQCNCSRSTCPKTLFVIGSNLRKGSTKGCTAYGHDITGLVVGTLTVIEPTNKRSGNNVVWLCHCMCERDTCPKTVFVTREHLVRGETQSCRCQQLVHPAIRNYFFQVKQSANKRNYH